MKMFDHKIFKKKPLKLLPIPKDFLKTVSVAAWKQNLTVKETDLDLRDKSLIDVITIMKWMWDTSFWNYFQEICKNDYKSTEILICIYLEN